MSYHNGYIPNFSSYEYILREKIEVLEAKLKLKQQQLDMIEKELNNVVESVKEHGYATLRYGNERIKLIEAPGGEK